MTDEPFKGNDDNSPFGKIERGVEQFNNEVNRIEKGISDTGSRLSHAFSQATRPLSFTLSAALVGLLWKPALAVAALGALYTYVYAKEAYNSWTPPEDPPEAGPDADGASGPRNGPSPGM